MRDRVTYDTCKIPCLLGGGSPMIMLASLVQNFLSNVAIATVWDGLKNWTKDTF